MLISSQLRILRCSHHVIRTMSLQILWYQHARLVREDRNFERERPNDVF